ncbi:probable G-protein coupled receptor 139 [Heptranchias perlo]|uniref:probable G-protein coupled receptor 139 n=1 Tax=Heptranchias perlo TaxID=212740 RepID=UPI00355AA757
MDYRDYVLILKIQCYFYYILAVIGIPANLVTIAILCRGKCGLFKALTLHLLTIALSDLMVIAFSVIFDKIIYFNVSLTFFSTPVCNFNQFMKSAFIDCSVWSTVAFTFDLFMAVCHQGLKAKYCTVRTAATVLGAIWVVSILRNIPEYIKYEPLVTMDYQIWGCRVKRGFGHLAGWAIFDWLQHILTPLIPYVSILLFNCLTVKHILAASSVRKRLRSQTINNGVGQNGNDAEVENRRKSIFLLFTISASFILLWMAKVINFILDRLAKVYYNPADFSHPLAILQQTGTMLMLLTSCVHTFIYVLTQTKFRREMLTGLTFPFTVIVQMSKLFKR